MKNRKFQSCFLHLGFDMRNTSTYLLPSEQTIIIFLTCIFTKKTSRPFWWLVVSTHLKNMPVKLGIISPGFRGENKKYLKPPPS